MYGAIKLEVNKSLVAGLYITSTLIWYFKHGYMVKHERTYRCSPSMAFVPEHRGGIRACRTPILLIGGAFGLRQPPIIKCLFARTDER
jgi:hypothetical protein